MDSQTRQGGFLSIPQVMCILDALDRSAAVETKMGATASRSGPLTDSWMTDERLSIAATWSYSSTGKLDVILEAESP